MSGREMAQQLEDSHPEVKILYMSGYTDDAVKRHDVFDSGTAFLQKPASSEVLLRKIRYLLDGSES
jgi:two-component SAPR family response regulator